ncbi:MAG: LytR C-terminal domain-containing protein [Atribacterota bacterium]|nr:LytR C-terminal domain-containing protein [Atribacterota bacterium]
MKDIDKNKIWIETIQGEPRYINGISYLVNDEEEVRKKVSFLIENSYKGLTIEVLNGNQMPGVAHRVANKMEQLGFKVINVDNADNFNYQKTVLIINKKNIQADKYINEFFDDLEVIRRDQPQSEADMTIIIGKNMIY